MAIKICLDAGHYGKYNRSPAVPEYYESDMTWKLHLLLKTELEKYGFEVKTTRADKNKDLYVTDRGLASKGCDMFLSLHSNAVGNGVNENVDHVALYHLTKDDNLTIDEKSQDLALKLAPVIADVMEVKNGARVMTRVSPTDKNGDGVMNDNYYGVLNGARIAGTPGMIIEHSFHTQTRATKWLMQDANLAKLAKAEADVIAEHYGMKKQDDTASYKVGDIVDFYGDTHYRGANSTERIACTAGEAEITAVSEGAKHPYHLKRTGKGGPYGWVDAGTFRKDAPEPTPVPDVPSTDDFTLGMRLLKKGCEGDDVRAMQILLEANGCGGKMNPALYGSYGSKTVVAIEMFQRKVGLNPDGICGKATWEKLLGV